jgi:hypothetical protein
MLGVGLTQMGLFNFTQSRRGAEEEPRRARAVPHKEHKDNKGRSRACHAKPRRCKEGQGLIGGRARSRAALAKYAKSAKGSAKKIKCGVTQRSQRQQRKARAF